MMNRRRRTKLKKMSLMRRFDLAHAGGCAGSEGVNVVLLSWHMEKRAPRLQINVPK